jgi:hypothetical protein
VIYRWTMPSLMPLLVPWLAILGLLALPGNRNAQAWWIWAPLGLVAGLVLGVNRLAENFSPAGEAISTGGLLVTSAAFGLAAAWLLGRTLKGQVRGLVFVALLLIVTVVGLANILVSQEADAMEATAMGVGMGLGSLGLALALTLAALCCRRRYSFGRLTSWTLLWLLGGWLLGMIPFCVLLAVQQTGFVGWYAPLLVGSMIAGCSFAVLLPFLALAGLNGFYRDRVAGMLGLTCPGAEPGNPPTMTPTITPGPTMSGAL